MTPQPKKYDDDDGRVIASMDVEGMRDHDHRIRRETQTARKNPQGEPMSSSEARRFTWYAIRAALLVVAVISVTWVLLILFMTEVLFR